MAQGADQLLWASSNNTSMFTTQGIEHFAVRSTYEGRFNRSIYAPPCKGDFTQSMFFILLDHGTVLTARVDVGSATLTVWFEGWRAAVLLRPAAWANVEWETFLSDIGEHAPQGGLTGTHRLFLYNLIASLDSPLQVFPQHWILDLRTLRQQLSIP